MNSPQEPIQDKVTAVNVDPTCATSNSSDGTTISVEPLVTTTEPSTSEKVRVEEFKITGHDLVAKVKQLIHEGNIRRIIIKNDEGRILVEIPLTIGVVGGVLGTAMFPVIAAIGAIGAVVAHLSIVIERQE